MVGRTVPQTTRRRSIERILGTYEGQRSGRTIVVIGGLHGNEPAGLDAVQAVFADLALRGLDMAGRLVGLAGNLKALALDQRFVERDLNRGWSSESCRRVATARPDESPEDEEQRGLLEVLHQLEAQSPLPLVVLDLHSTSGPAAPFAVIPDVRRTRALALRLPIPTLLGLEEILDGAMFGYLVERGHTGVAIEGGQHHDPNTTARLEAVIWLALVAMGNLRPEQVPALDRHRQHLRDSVVGLPQAVHIVHRHGTAEGEGFQMAPGFKNFSPVTRGQQLAQNHAGPIYATFDGLVMLPRYQGQGDDGFFLGTEVTPRWLMLSASARRIRADRLLRLWPNIERDPTDPNRVGYRGTQPPAPLLAILRLLGFHGTRARPPGLEFFRRRP